MLLDKLVQRCLQSNDDVIIPVEGLTELKRPLTQALCAREVFVSVIDRAPIYNKETMLHAFYQNCEFPGYFGFNWNALLDCLTNFEWKPAKGYVLIYQDPSALQSEHPLVWEQLVDFIGYAGERWKSRAVPFKMLIPTNVPMHVEHQSQ